MGCSNFLDYLVFQMIVQSVQSSLVDEVNKIQSGYWIRPDGKRKGKPFPSEVPQQTINEDAGSVGGFVNGYYTNKGGVGKVMTDVNELVEGKLNSFHIHRFKDKEYNNEESIGISYFKPDGTVERFKFRKK